MAEPKDDLDVLYSYNEHKLNAIKEACPWMTNPKYFQRVKISPSAAVKMTTHGQSGVEKGIKKNGKPVEVMGLLLGKPDINDEHCLIITDAQALPIEGFETKVIADDESVVNYMIELSGVNEMSRKENFCGWYHTHPFDVDVNSHCYLSTTDVSTQLQWQRAEDRHGNPWLAIVIDPLRSLAKGRPELMAFRVYPPDYSPPANETPDGSIVADERSRIEKWGTCWNRYYCLEVSYFMSSLAHDTLSVLKNNFLWMNTLTTSPHDSTDYQNRASERIDHISAGVVGITGGVGEAGDKRDVTKLSQGCSELGVEHCQCMMSKIAKNLIFGLSRR